MHQRMATALRAMFKLLPCVLFLPVITGFDNAPISSAAPASQTAAAPALLPPTSPTSPAATAPLPALSVFDWRHDKNKERESSLFAAAEPFAATAKEDEAPEPVLNWETGAGKSYMIPALELPTFLVLLNIFDRAALGNKTTDNAKNYSSTFSSTWEHLSRQNWHFDNDGFKVNQFGHPYQGATMYGIARSCGLNFWESFGYSHAGSFAWEMAGETTRPSFNDIITTGNAGSLLGEALFRMAELVLKENGPKPDAWHELGAAVISPPTALNRYVYGDRFKTIFPSHAPATFWSFRLGASLNSSSQPDANLDFNMSYGLPGKPGYTYTRPLDYFDFQIGGLFRASNPVGNVLLRGLLYGKDYQAGENYRGIWGLYGSYDYLSPSVFRVSTTALSLGTTGQYWAAPDVSLQGTLLGGAGFGAAGVTPVASDKRDYHYGVAPHLLLSLRLLFGTRAALDLVGRGYYVTGAGSDEAGGSEKIGRITTALTVRVYRRHGIGLQFVESIRDAQYAGLPGSHQTDGTLSLVYSFLGDSHLGAVEWREGRL
jgi:hypothetical protein